MIHAVYQPEEQQEEQQEEQYDIDDPSTTVGGEEDKYIRNMSVLIRPLEDTVLAQPGPSPCSQGEITLVVTVMSAPGNFLERSTIRRTWGEKLLEYPGVTLLFLLGRHHNDSQVHVS